MTFKIEDRGTSGIAIGHIFHDKLGVVNVTVSPGLKKIYFNNNNVNYACEIKELLEEFVDTQDTQDILDNTK